MAPGIVTDFTWNSMKEEKDTYIGLIRIVSVIEGLRETDKA